MSDVTIQISGRPYTVACGEGEEAHIAHLGRTIDAKLADIPNLANQSEARVLLFAALLLADDLHEAQAATARGAGDDGEATAASLDRLAARLETIASQLETGAAAS